MPATFIGSTGSFHLNVTSSTLHFGSVSAGDIICFNVGSVGVSGPYWKITDNLGNGTATDGFGNPVYAKGATQYIETVAGGFWAISQIDGDLTVTIETFTAADFVTPLIISQLNNIRVYRFPKVYAIDQASVAIGAAPLGGGFNQAFRSGPVNYADTLVVSAIMCPTSVADFTSLTGDTLQDTVIQPSGGPFIPERWLLVLDRSSTYSETDQSGDVQFQYNGTAGPGGFSSMAVMTFSVPTAAGPNCSTRSGAGFDNNPSPIDGDQQADWNRPLIGTFPGKVRLGDLVFVDVLVPINPATITVADDYGGNVYTQRIICPPTGSGSVGAGYFMAIYTCVVRFLPPDGGIFQVRLNADSTGSSAVYQMTGIGLMAIRKQQPVNIAVAGFKSVVQVVQSAWMSTDEVPFVPRGTYLHAFAAQIPSNAMFSMTWTAMEDYTIRSHWDVFQSEGEPTNFPRLAALAVMDKIVPLRGNYDAQATAELTAYGGLSNIVLIAVTYPYGWMISES